MHLLIGINRWSGAGGGAELFPHQRMINRTDIANTTAFLKGEAISFEAGVPLREFSYFKSGGTVQLIVFPETADELERFVRFMHREKTEYKLIGETSNLLFLDGNQYGIFLSLKAFSRIDYFPEEKIIKAESGASLPGFTRKALLWGITGFEELEGIPGTIGGGIFMNAGAYGCEIRDCLMAVHGVEVNGEPFRFLPGQLEFESRNSLFRKNPERYIITHAEFSAQRGEPEKIYSRMELLHAKRHKYQDFLYPTLGTLFSNTDVYTAIGRGDKRYCFLLGLLKRLFYWKRIRRELPMNRRLLNRFVCAHFGWEFEVQPFSDKNMNCLANHGQHTDRFLEYIELLKKHLPETSIIENEIMTDYLFEE